jgi:hypothetical protein
LSKQDSENSAKGSLEKQVLAWWLRKKPVVSLQWISQRLGMGDVSRVIKAVRAVASDENGEMTRQVKRLERNS